MDKFEDIGKCFEYCSHMGKNLYYENYTFDFTNGVQITDEGKRRLEERLKKQSKITELALKSFEYYKKSYLFKNEQARSNSNKPKIKSNDIFKQVTEYGIEISDYIKSVNERLYELYEPNKTIKAIEIWKEAKALDAPEKDPELFDIIKDTAAKAGPVIDAYEWYLFKCRHC